MARRNRQMCVKIAQDVLTQLRLNRYRARSGWQTYVSVHAPEFHSLAYSDWQAYDRMLSKVSFKDFFKSNEQPICDVCMLGAAFVSLVNIENKCTIRNVIEQKDMFKRLEEYFGGNNMQLMESAFECRIMDDICYSNVSDELLEEAALWGSRYNNPKERLRAIMLNVIRNKGDFKLPKKHIARATKRVKKDNMLLRGA